ncbi:hypothetical protein CONLIGDRAFT_650115 [Coniochaeta ligniaria NRRL 30616]|uniref:Uncharacterized protein n=1 Tax=Coniochaeta ligniaria NRRL 30616 TaxID=1408157 RepID=A0A1J7IPG2_9PEZI|nr:hypothetical protein CONLIGDRAFT_650115 [Coniochaeta ligniaria NRRL 30616]
MHSFLVSALLVGVPFVVGAPASPDVFARASLEERDSCHADNLLRLLRTPTNLPQALPFCSSYLHYPASTSVVSTVTPIVLSTTTATVSLTDVLTSTITSIDTAFSTETATAEATVTVTTQQIAVPVKKRTGPCVKKPLSETVLSSYDAAGISSACACLTIPISVSLTTATAPVQTQISSATATVETTTTAFETELTTTTLGTTVTTSTTSTATVGPPPVPTNFRLTGTNSTGAKIYFKQLKYGSLYDILATTTNASESETFHLDATNRLYYQSVQFSAPAFAFYSDPWANNNRVPATTSAAMFAFQTDRWLAASSSPVYRGFTWSIDPYSLELTQTSFPGVTLLLQSCRQLVGSGNNYQTVILIGQQLLTSSCSLIGSYLTVESV